MKGEKWVSGTVAVVLGLLTALGAVGCLCSAFGLNVENPEAMILGIVTFTVFVALCLMWKQGALIVLGVAALGAGFLWRSGAFLESLSAVAAKLTDHYSRAYGWNTLGTAGGRADEGMLALGCLVGGCVGWTVIRRKNGSAALILSMIPLGLCVVVTDTVPGIGYLLMLLTGVLELILTGHLRRKNPGQANTLAAMAAVPVALVLGGLLLAAPEDTYVNRAEDYRNAVLDWVWRIPQWWKDLSEGGDVRDVMSGLDGAVQPQSVDLGTQGPRELLSYPVMDVIAPKRGTQYLREQDYNEYDGTGWSSSPEREEIFGGTDPDIWKRVGVVTICTRRDRDVRCLPYYPADPVTLIGGSMDNAGDLSIYEVAQSALVDNWRQLVTESRAQDADSQYLQLPRSTRNWAQTLTEQILTDQISVTEKADAIAAYVRRSAAYDLQTQAMPAGEGDFARWFLEESDTGYCVHFATATAVLLRAAGIRSRYVMGYLFTAEANQPVTVTAAEAHAWVEYYEPSLGAWIILESTPAGQTGGEPGTDETEEQREPEKTRSEETEEIPTAGERESREPETRDTGRTGTEDQNDPGSNTVFDRFGAVLGWILGISAATGAVILQRWGRMNRRRAAMTRGSTNRRALAMWREVRRYARALGEAPPGDLETLTEKAKYSQHTLTNQELKLFRDYLTQSRKRCAQKPWYGRVVDRWVWALY